MLLYSPQHGHTASWRRDQSQTCSQQKLCSHYIFQWSPVTSYTCLGFQFFCDITRRSSVSGTRRFEGGVKCQAFNVHWPWAIGDEDGNFHPKVRKHIPGDEVSYPRKMESSITRLWKPKIGILYYTAVKTEKWNPLLRGCENRKMESTITRLWKPKNGILYYTDVKTEKWNSLIDGCENRKMEFSNTRLWKPKNGIL